MEEKPRSHWLALSTPVMWSFEARTCVAVGISTLCSAWRGYAMHSCTVTPAAAAPCPICTSHCRPKVTLVSKTSTRSSSLSVTGFGAKWVRYEVNVCESE